MSEPDPIDSSSQEFVVGNFLAHAYYEPGQNEEFNIVHPSVPCGTSRALLD